MYFYTSNSNHSAVDMPKFCATEKQNGRQPRFVPHAFVQEAQRKHKMRLAVSHIVDRKKYCAGE